MGLWGMGFRVLLEPQTWCFEAWVSGAFESLKIGAWGVLQSTSLGSLWAYRPSKRGVVKTVGASN